MKPLTSTSPHAIIMVGIPGSGKSTFADRFADTFQAPIVSQTKLEREFGLSFETARSLRDLILAEYIKLHRTILIDGGLDAKDEREELVKKLKKVGYQPLIVWVQTDTAEALRRAVKPYPRGSGLSPEKFDELVGVFNPPHEKEKTVVISGKHTYNSQLKIILKQLAAPDPKAGKVVKPATLPALQPHPQSQPQPEPEPPTRSRSRQVFIR